MVWLVAVSALPLIPELGRKPGTDAYYDLEQHEDCETIAGLRILRFDGGLFFVNADSLGDRLRQIRIETEATPDSDVPLQGVILSMEGVNFIDAEGADVLKAIADAADSIDVDLHLARIKPQVSKVLERDGFFDLISRGQVHDDIAAAVSLHRERHPRQAAPDDEDGPPARRTEITPGTDQQP